MTFTKENVENLQSINSRMSALLKEHNDGQFMLSQLEFLGQLIKEFKNNPIVKNSGI